MRLVETQLGLAKRLLANEANGHRLLTCEDVHCQVTPAYGIPCSHKLVPLVRPFGAGRRLLVITDFAVYWCLRTEQSLDKWIGKADAAVGPINTSHTVLGEAFTLDDDVSTLPTDLVITNPTLQGQKRKQQRAKNKASKRGKSSSNDPRTSHSGRILSRGEEQPTLRVACKWCGSVKHDHKDCPSKAGEDTSMDTQDLGDTQRNTQSTQAAGLGLDLVSHIDILFFSVIPDAL